MARKSFAVMVAGTMIFFLSAVSSAVVPDKINYQGKLTTASGGCLNDMVQMIFSIYPDTLGLSADWSETQTDVIVKEGIFNVLLGSVNPIPGGDTVFDGSTKYLGVQVESDPEMRPLKPMVSEAYAYRCLLADSAAAGSDKDWDLVGKVLFTHFKWGIAKYSSVLLGDNARTHVNLGVACTTGTNEYNQDYCTVGGGQWNTAREWWSTVGGGQKNTANGTMATVGGGYENTAKEGGTVGGGSLNTASGGRATVAGGKQNTASGGFATVPGGRADTAAGDASLAAGDSVRITSAGDYTFAFGRNFTTATPNAVIFHNSSDEIKVGIGVTNPGNILTVQQGSTTDPIADAWTLHSSRDYKKDIHELTPQEYRQALEKVVSVPVVKFRYKTADTKEKIGLIVEDAPAEIVAEGNSKAISLNEYVSLLHAALKAQQEEIDALKAMVNALTKE